MTFISYAQNLEDVMLWRALKHINHGFYMDVGANDPSVHSVTRAFYELGWHGINIEPLKHHFIDLERERTRDLNLCCAVGAASGELELWAPTGASGLSTLDQEVIAQHLQTGYEGTYQSVPVVTLESIFTTYVKQDVHFLKIDVEGFEEAVLKGANFKQHRPWILVIEATKPISTEENYKQWEPLVLNEGYLFVYADGLNRFYVAMEHASLMPSFIYPPNVFDDFILSTHLSMHIRADCAETALANVYASLSWRITQPFRVVVNASREVIQRCKAVALMNKKEMILSLLNQGMFFIKQHPRLNHVARRLLSRFPHLKERLLFKKKLNFFSVTQLTDLSARARDVYEALKIAEKNKKMEG
jgi:FkbM family methyltransferase